MTVALIALSTSSTHPLLPKIGFTSLIIASYCGQTSVLQALLQGGATMNATTQVRHKLLHGYFQRVGIVSGCVQKECTIWSVHMLVHSRLCGIWHSCQLFMSLSLHCGEFTLMTA